MTDELYHGVFNLLGHLEQIRELLEIRRVYDFYVKAGRVRGKKSFRQNDAVKYERKDVSVKSRNSKMKSLGRKH